MTAVRHDPTTAAPARPTGRRTRRTDRAGMAWTAVAWLAGLLFFLPVLWMVLTGFKREVDAASNPPSWVFPPVLDGYRQVFDRDITPYLLNSLMASLLSTLLVLLLATPAAYALSIRPVTKWRDVLFFFISTKMLPAVAALLPIYLLVKELGLLDNIWTMIVLYTAMNLPLAVWMMRSFLLEVPPALIEAAAVDGASLLVTIRRILLPIVAPGLAATALICFIFSWNEFFFAVNLTATRAGTSPIFLVGFITSEGLFLARLCAAATLVSLPVVLAGWIAQKQLVRGLSMGAVK
ncbi:carbohydrate ABC transporter permease [Micromonospora sp. WMMD812]|uniref:carbohydrate ABC transporter permease n=1 Tax=Micromonospora sp. WMMD812 TaxID=3015152 RepID=UPI00248C1E7A|nr:carbohydrate ABC transporter permease [Micromonospora sp. WMMD812]WBB67980.1 carbohydrate ABC transporter permease [Micromonospora sp. WMMD812]